MQLAASFELCKVCITWANFTHERPVPSLLMSVHITGTVSRWKCVLQLIDRFPGVILSGVLSGGTYPRGIKSGGFMYRVRYYQASGEVPINRLASARRPRDAVAFFVPTNARFQRLFASCLLADRRSYTDRTRSTAACWRSNISVASLLHHTMNVLLMVMTLSAIHVNGRPII